MVKIFDMSTRMHSEATANIDALDDLFNQFGVAHAFALPTEADIDEDEDVELKVLWMQEDEITFDLVVMLFCKTVLKRTDEQIKEIMKKVVEG